MVVLGIETSCDETAAAIVKDGTRVLAHQVASSLEIQSQYGGIVPEVAARHQTEYMIPVLTKTFEEGKITPAEIDAIAVTIGPGLIGSLLVGVETAKILSYIWQKPCVPVNHMIGHIHSAWLDEQSPTKPQFPLLALIVSGGHTDLIYMTAHDQLQLIGSTRDDAVGEAFDKIARILGLGYPGGPIVEKYAALGDPTAFAFPRPMHDSNDFNFSYSGLKTAVVYELQNLHSKDETVSLDEKTLKDLCASFRAAAFDVLIEKTIRAAKTHAVKSILVTGGVAASRHLKDLMTVAVQNEFGNNVTLHIPPLKLATDNATYIAATGEFLFDKLALDPKDKLDLEKIMHLPPNPNLTSTDWKL